MNELQKATMERVRTIVEEQCPDGHRLVKFEASHVKERWCDFVSLCVWFRPLKAYAGLKSAHFFIGPKGGLTYPMHRRNTGMQYEKRFAGDVAQVIRDQEKDGKATMERLRREHPD